MELQLKNIGMIKEANVKIDGLTVIAGENDTGKSTVGKALFFIKEFKYLAKDVDLKKFISDKNYKSILNHLEKFESDMKKLDFEIENLSDMQSISEVMKKIQRFVNRIESLEKVLKEIENLRNLSPKELEKLETKEKYNTLSGEFEKFFYFPILDNAKIKLKSKEYSIEFGNKKFSENGRINTYHSIFIETPIILNLFDYFSKLDTIQNDIKYNINNYPYTLRSLYKQLKLELKDESSIDKKEILDILNDTVKGETKMNSNNGEVVFIRNDEQFNIQSVATGIKSFGILQMLLKNNYLTKNSILILDEPEVHLHPKWQLEMAKLIVELVKNGVKVLVNSHSPYMVEALERYGEKAEINMDFYLAEDGFIDKINDNNSATLSRVFEKLSAPFDVFDEMDSEKLRNG